MQHVALRIFIGDKSVSSRRFKTTFWFTYSDSFYYDEPYYEHFFWGIRVGRCSQGIHYAEFSDAETGNLLKVLSGTDVPNRWKGYCGPTPSKMFAVGIRFRYDYNEGRAVYRTLPCGLRTRFIKRANRRLLVDLSDYFWTEYERYWVPYFEDDCGFMFNQDAPFWLSQRERKLRQCVGITPVGVGVERRLLLV